MPVWKQGAPDCTGWATKVAADLAASVNVFHRGDRWPGFAAPEPIYGGARIEIGEGRAKGDGAHCRWAVEWLRRYGTLYAQKYREHDLTTYDPDRSKKWGDDGVPDYLEPIARLHPFKTVDTVDSWEDVRDATAGGFPVIIGSKRGFCTKCGRDKNGFMHPKGKWYHAMAVIGIDDTARPGALLYNPWGYWVKGPRRFDQPACSFWVDAEVIDEMARYGDSHAISGFVGFPSRTLERLW